MKTKHMKRFNDTREVMQKVFNLLEETGWEYRADMSRQTGTANCHSWTKTVDGEELTIWTKGTKINSAWRKDGGLALERFRGKPIFEHCWERINKEIEETVIKDLINCSGCKKTLKREKEGGSHFAGHFCKECWEQYKEENRRKCGICNAPMWRCHC